MKRVVLMLMLLSVLCGCAQHTDEEYAALEVQLAEKSEEIQGLQERLKSAESAVETLTTEKAELKDEIIAINLEADGLYQQAAKDRQIILALEKENETLKKESFVHSYDASITYDKIVGNPDEYKNKKVVFNGYVLEAYVTDDDFCSMRISTDGKYDDDIFVAYYLEDVDVVVEEGEKILAFGTFLDMCEYNTLSGRSRTIPLVSAESIEIIRKAQ